MGLPVRNGGNELAEAMESLLEQTYPDFTIVVSDNASDDDTSLTSQTFMTRDSRVKYSRNPENIGILANFNRALLQADAPLFMWAAHDHRYPRTFLEELVRLADESPAAVGAVPTVEYVKPETGERRSIRPDLGLRSDRRRLRLRAALRPGSVYSVYGLYRTGVLNDIGGIPLVYPADVALVASVALRGPIVHSEPTRFLYIDGSSEARRGREPLIARRISSLFAHLWRDTTAFGGLERTALRLELILALRHRWIRDRLSIQLWDGPRRSGHGRAVWEWLSRLLAIVASPSRALRRLRRLPDRPPAVS